MEFPPGRNSQSNSVLDPFSAEIRRPGPGKDHDFYRTVAWMQAQAITSKEANRTYVATGKFIFADQIADSLSQLGLRILDLYSINCGGGIQPCEMIIEAKDRRTIGSLVTANSFKNSAAIVQAISGDVDGGTTPRNKLPVHPDPLCFFKSHYFPRSYLSHRPE